MQRIQGFQTRNDLDFVDPIDWGQLERDRQTQIDAAYHYITEVRGKPYKEGKIGREINYPLFFLKLITFFLFCALALAIMDHFEIVNLQEFYETLL